MALSLSWPSAIRLLVLLLLLAGITTACVTLPIEKILKDFLVWIKQNLGPWGPLVLAIAYIPLTVLAVPASILTLGGGYLFGLPIGFLADSIGATIGATAAFLLGRTIGKPLVMSKLKDYPQFQAVAIAIQRSGFKIVLLLRLVPLLPFNMLNYLLSVTPVSIGEYMMASWLGMMFSFRTKCKLLERRDFGSSIFCFGIFGPLGSWIQRGALLGSCSYLRPITFALVYVGTTLKDLSDVTHGWSEISTTRWVMLVSGIVLSVILIICVTKVAKSSLERALLENDAAVDVVASSQLPISVDPSMDLHQPLIIKVDPLTDGHEK